MNKLISQNPEPAFTFQEMENLSELKRQNTELATAMRRMAALHENVLPLRASTTLQEALDTMELLIDEIVDFTYLRLYFYPLSAPGDDEDQGFDEARMHLARNLCPGEYSPNWDLINWAVDKGEVAFIPLEDQGAEAEDSLQNQLLVLPLIGHNQKVGVLLLWGNFDMTTFTQERSNLLNTLARESASVIQTLRMRQELETARAQLAEVVENIPLGIMALDSRERIILLNGTAEFIFNCRRDEAIGLPARRVLPPNIMAKIRGLIQGTEHPEIEGGELTLKLSGKFSDPFAVSVSPLHNLGLPGEAEENFSAAPSGHVIVCRDMKLTQEVAKLRDLDTMKNDFISLVSHELRTPLTSIMAYSETLLLDGMVESEEEQKEFIEIIHTEGARLQRLINDVLDLTKMETGKMEYRYEETDIGKVISSATASIQSLATQKNIRLECELEEGLPLVNADQDKLIQVFTNLYSNAIKFTDEDGSITTRARFVAEEEDEKATGPMLEVSVTDTGVGIAPEDIHRVFARFEQIEKVKHHSKGTGLGMPIVKQIIEDGHAGKIWIESEVGIGTTVFFRLPVI